MTVTLSPNVEALVSAFLRSRSEMTALIAQRVYTALPADVVYPAVRVTQLDDIPVTTRPLHLVSALVQVEAWGGSKSEAWNAAATARALLDELVEGVHTQGVVTGTRVGSLRDEPDITFTPAKPRWLFTCELFCHPSR